MKVLILAGGFGTRLSEYTESIPKPMVAIGNKPILWHIMKLYSNFGFNEFYIALGYKSSVIVDYFKNYKSSKKYINNNFEKNNIYSFIIEELNWKVNLVYTGEKTMTGGRVKRMQQYIGNNTFMLTYGDGVANINVKKLIDFHNSHGKIATITTVRPPARFGALTLKGNKVISFREKSQIDEGWINGGFFVINPNFFDFIDNDDSIFLEKEPLEKVALTGNLIAYKHEGFWQPMDTKRDRDKLEEMYSKGDTPWLI